MHRYLDLCILSNTAHFLVQWQRIEPAWFTSGTNTLNLPTSDIKVQYAGYSSRQIYWSVYTRYVWFALLKFPTVPWYSSYNIFFAESETPFYTWLVAYLTSGNKDSKSSKDKKKSHDDDSEEDKEEDAAAGGDNKKKGDNSDDKDKNKAEVSMDVYMVCLVVIWRERTLHWVSLF